MRKWNYVFIAATATALSLGGVAQAAPLVDLSILGSTTGQAGSYSSSLSGLTSGETIFVEVVGQLAPIGTTDGTKTITSESSTSDGISSLGFNLSASDSPTFSNAALAKPANGANVDWTGGSGTSAGAVSGNSVTDIRPAINGVDGAVNGSPDLIWTGQLTMGAVSTTVNGSWATTGTTSGAFKINGGSSVFVTSTTESGANPYVGYSALSLTETSVPEPASLSLLGLGSLTLLARRRRQA